MKRLSYSYSRVALLAVLIILQVLISELVVSGSKSFEAHRLLQYDRNRQPFGSRKSFVDHLASPLQGTHDLGRNIAIIRMSDLTIDLLSSLQQRRAQSLLIVLPRNFSDVTEKFVSEFQQLETFFLTHSLDLSVFFAFDTDVISQVFTSTDEQLSQLADAEETEKAMRREAMKMGKKPQRSHSNGLSAALALDDRYHLKGSEKSEMISSIQYTNLFSVLKRGNRQLESEGGEKSDDSSVETEEKYIVICSNHDAFGVAPTLAVGANENGSGIASLISLLIMFHNLYNDVKQPLLNEKYNLLFLLTTGGYSNFEGTRRWLEQTDGGSLFLKSIEMVVCLDALGIGDQLYLHTTTMLDEVTSNNTKDNSGLDLYRFKQTLQSVTQRRDMPFHIRSKPLSSDSPINGWHHEAFARKGLLSMTFSAKAVETQLYKGSSILDRSDRISRPLLQRNIEFIGDVLAMIIYDLSPNTDGVATLNDLQSNYQFTVNPSYLQSYINFLGAVPRFGPYHFRSAYLRKLHEDLVRYSSEAKRMKYRPETAFEKFYSTSPVTIEVFLVKPFAFDMIFMVATLSYCFVFYVAMKAPKSWAEFMQIWADK